MTIREGDLQLAQTDAGVPPISSSTIQQNYLFFGAASEHCVRDLHEPRAIRRHARAAAAEVG